MKTSNTAERLQTIMSQRNLRQIDILNLAKPYCEQYNVKLGKTDLSQYVNGKVEPGQTKLTILGLALNVDESWLMGLDVPMEREKTPTASGERSVNDDDIKFALFGDAEIDDELYEEVKAFARFAKERKEKRST